jgi:acyl carrier protein
VDKRFRLTIEEAVNEHFFSLGVAPPESPQSDLRSAGLNSLQIVDLILLLETNCGIEIPISERTPDNFRSVETIIGVFQRLKDDGMNVLPAGHGQ